MTRTPKQIELERLRQIVHEMHTIAESVSPRIPQVNGKHRMQVAVDLIQELREANSRLHAQRAALRRDEDYDEPGPTLATLESDISILERRIDELKAWRKG